MSARLQLQLDQWFAGTGRPAAGAYAPDTARVERMRSFTGDVLGSKRGLHRSMRRDQRTFGDEWSPSAIGAAGNSWPLDNRRSGAESMDRGGRP